MSNNHQKESARAGRKAPQPTSQPASPKSGHANAANTLDATLLQSLMDSLRSDIFEKIDGLSTSIRSEIASVRQELRNSIDPLQRTVDAHEATVHELERAATDHNTRINDLEATVSMLTKQATRLEDKCEDLEGRSRRNNICVVGVPEGVEGSLLDRAHRTLREKPREGMPPQPFVARIHLFHVRILILQQAGEASPLLYNARGFLCFQTTHPPSPRSELPSAQWSATYAPTQMSSLVFSTRQFSELPCRTDHHTGLRILLLLLTLSIKTVSRLFRPATALESDYAVVTYISAGLFTIMLAALHSCLNRSTWRSIWMLTFFFSSL